jgi:hypothetical protein
MIDIIYIKMDKYLISRLNVANSEFCENGVTRKIPHGDFEKLAGMKVVTTNKSKVKEVNITSKEGYKCVTLIL